MTQIMNRKEQVCKKGHSSGRLLCRRYHVVNIRQININADGVVDRVERGSGAGAVFALPAPQVAAPEIRVVYTLPVIFF